mmetsp:Transcript_46276/g.72464  ORF Transcript_46276/g.72464 Transcript_46276/m.72464 type:complete len:228 (-) Transcript_46276:517-1200(-)
MKNVSPTQMRGQARSVAPMLRPGDAVADRQTLSNSIDFSQSAYRQQGSPYARINSGEMRPPAASSSTRKPVAPHNDEDILSQSFDAINRLAMGGGPLGGPSGPLGSQPINFRSQLSPSAPQTPLSNPFREARGPSYPQDSRGPSYSQDSRELSNSMDPGPASGYSRRQRPPHPLSQSYSPHPLGSSAPWPLPRADSLPRETMVPNPSNPESSVNEFSTSHVFGVKEF